MAVFSISLIRLIYDMSHDTTSPVLYIMSNWTVLSVGIIDGLVYVSLFSKVTDCSNS